MEAPTVRARYRPGLGLLVGHRSLWVLLTEPDDPQVVEEVWEIVRRGGAEAAVRILEVVGAAYSSTVPALALLDLARPSAPLTRGSGRVHPAGAAFVLTLGAAAPLSEPHQVASELDEGRALVGGVVAADRAVLTAVPRTPSSTAQIPAQTPALIDGIPSAILAARGPDGPPPPPPPPPPRDPGPADAIAPDATTLDANTVDATTVDATLDAVPADRDGATVQRTHLSSQDLATVVAVSCPQGHLTTPALPNCRICGQRIAPQEPRTVLRPTLGGLRLPTGEIVPLDRGVVIGRRPSPVPGATDWPHLVHLPSTHAFVSRMHLQIELQGWDVLARDLCSSGGSVLTAPGRPPTPMRADEAYVLEPGTVLELAGVYAVRYETGVVAQ